jgi:hypothetical protein
MVSGINMQLQSQSNLNVPYQHDTPIEYYYSRADINPGNRRAYFGGGWRASGPIINPPSIPTDPDPTNPYDTFGSDFKNTPTNITSNETLAFCPVERGNGYNWQNLGSSWATNLTNSFGTPNSINSTQWHNGSNPYYNSYSSTFGGGQNACVLNLDSVKRMGQKWTNHDLNSSTPNAFNRLTLKRGSGINTLFGFDTTFDIWQPYQCVRGFLLSKILPGAWSSVTTIGSREGRIYGKFFATVIVTARYY